MKTYLLDTKIISYLTDSNSPHKDKIKEKLLSLSEDDTVNDLDFLIAATAINHNAILVSNDAIFNKLIELEPSIKYENWI